MTITTELLTELETASRHYKVTSDQAADLFPEGTPPEAEEVTITWQRCTGRVPSVLVTVPTGPDRWAVPVPHRPDWLAALITKAAPGWWLA
ncbi:hypothetical protein ACKI16_29675 [Streptomyces scabiei]|uniref:hypothetical protein n=1 Tax=Streptomyces scabiei TaxID=1930 RepID=UPI0038F7BA1B